MRDSRKAAHALREEVAATERQVLDDEVKVVVREFGARDGDVSDLSGVSVMSIQARENTKLGHIRPKIQGNARNSQNAK